MTPISSFIKSSFGIFLLALLPFLWMLYFYDEVTQNFLDSRFFGVGIFLAFVLTYALYRSEVCVRKFRDMLATWIGILVLFMAIFLYRGSFIDRNLFGSLLLWYVFIIFWDWRRI
jgi:hypothetical protein